MSIERSTVRVLLIEDKEADARLVQILLAQQHDVDFRIVWADRLATGLAHLTEETFDVLLLDLNLPDSQGLETFTRVKAVSGRMPIIVSSDTGEREIPLRAVREGAQDFLPKRALDGDQLSRSIRYAVERGRAEEALARRNEELTLINDIADKVGRSLDLGQILDDALREIVNLRILGPDIHRGVIFLKNPQTGRLEAATTYGLTLDLPCLTRSIKVGECLCGLAVERSKVITSQTGWRDERHTIRGEQALPHRDLCIPLTSQQGVNGVISLWLTEDYEITDANKDILRAVAGHIGMAIENARLYEEARHRSSELTSLSHTAQLITSSLDLDAVLNRVVAEVYTMLGAEAALLLLYEPKADKLRLAAFSGQPSEEIEGLRISASEGIAGWILKSGQPILVDSVQVHPLRQAWIDCIVGTTDHALIAVPLRFQRETVGILAAIDGECQLFDQQSLQLLDTLSGFIAVAIENARLYKTEWEQRKLLEESQDRMVQSEKLAATGRLAASLAHEINNPLQAIHTSLQMMLSFSEPTDRQREYIHIAEGEVARLMAMVRRIVDFARPIDRNLRSLDVNEVIGEMFDLTHKHLQHRAVNLRKNLAADLPFVEADADELKQVFLNLILNAVEAMPEEGVLTIASFKGGDDQVGIAFEDTGVGIPSENLPYLFEPFFSTKEEGTGLGLSISYMLIERHGGKITVTSQVHHGTTFTVWLPALPVHKHTVAK